MSQLVIQKTFYKVSDFIAWQKSGTLVLSPQFQRNSVWKKGTKSYLIDTIVRGLPIPIVFIRDRRVNLKTLEYKREVIDGQQRLRTVIGFVAPKLLSDFDDRDNFTVKRTHNKDIAGVKFSDLPPEVQSKILEYEFNVHVLSTDVDDREILQIFRRMNSSSYALNNQELRNSQWFGEFKSSMYALAEEQLSRWRDWKTFTIDDIARMQEVELTSEFAVMMIDKELLGRTKARIDNAYEQYDEIFPDRNEIERRFRTVMDTIDDKLGNGFYDSPLSKKTVIYSTFSVFYNLLFGLDSDLKKSKVNSITSEQINVIKLASDRIDGRTAPNNILEATARRTTNPKERKLVYDYLLGKK